MKRPILARLHDYFLPHQGNGYKPHVFRAASVVGILLVVLVLEGAYLAQVVLVFPRTNFLASVLPGTLIALTNDDRATNQVGTLVENPLLDAAATLAAEDMASKSYFAHVSPAGVTPWDWLNQIGYHYTYAGQNLAVNFTDSSAVESAWMASPGHRANIVKPQYTEIGIGTATGVFQGREAVFVVQYFGTPLASGKTPTKTPVVVKPIAKALATTSLARATTTVLGTEVGPPAPSLLVQAAASPTHTILRILSILLGVVLVLFLIAIIRKARVQYLEVIGGGLVLIGVLIGLLIFNATRGAPLQLPPDSSTAATQSP